MKKFGLIGHPIAHSLSPALFKAAYGGRYPYELIEGDDFEKSYEIFLKEYNAINVTAPFKEMAYRKAPSHSSACEVIGATNILIKQENTIKADNSDVLGVTGALAPYRESLPKNPLALIIGCGGAAKAAAYATWHCLGCKTVIMNRDISKAQNFIKRLMQTGNTTAISAAGLEDFRKHFQEADIIIYTLPIAIPALSELKRSDITGGALWDTYQRKIILEANYKDPAFTPEIQAKMSRHNHKLTFISGKEWLLHQAVGAYRIFTGESPDIEAMKAVIA
jgi:shikimate dehydrogenase